MIDTLSMSRTTGRRRGLIWCLWMMCMFSLGVMLALPACAFAREGEAAGDDETVLSATSSDGAEQEDEGAATLVANEVQSPDLLLSQMSWDEKISQMIIPAIRTWNGRSVTNLDEVPELAEALRAHNYGGLILYASNVSNAQQLTRLTSALQTNNATVSSIPYFMCIDGEGGAVTRLTMGTRMTGSMAIGATGAAGVENARKTGEVIGKEIAAAGFNVDFAPDVDVNSNASNPVIGTRSFSDDPQLVAELGPAFAAGLNEQGVVATYKHFPGHGDTGTDTHIDTAAVYKTYDELYATELVPFQRAVEQGAELIMTAHITLPNLEGEETTFADGTPGCYPATMSSGVLTKILRQDMGYDGVIVTDALEMDALYAVQLVEGGGTTRQERKASAEYGANLAIKVIEAGGDILLLPTDLVGATAASYYDEYISLLATKAQNEPAFAARIDESVMRILQLKERHGILAMDTSGAEADAQAAAAEQMIGSDANHDIEASIARQAATLLKNDNHALPVSGHSGNIVLLGRNPDDMATVTYAVGHLQELGLLDPNARVVNLTEGTVSGPEDAPVTVTIDYYRDYTNGEQLRYTDEMKQAIAQADSVIAFTAEIGLYSLQPSSVQYKGITLMAADAHAAGATFTVLSNNLPYDAARYQVSDAIVCTYMYSGLDVDASKRSDAGTRGAYNANAICALEMMFDGFAPSGTLPVNIPALTVVNEETGTVAYSNEPFYTRGTGLQSFDYDFVAGMNGSHEKGSATGLSFRANARHDKLMAVQVDGTALSETDCVVGAGSTTFELPAAYLDTLAEGDHNLAAVYDYGTGPFTLSTSFSITKQASPAPEPGVKKGSVHTVSGMAYTVTKVAGAKAAGTVTLKTAKAAATVAVPASVKIGGKTYKVTAIGTKAFSKAAKKVVTVSVGANVATIGASAFAGCAKLKTVKGGAGVTTIGAGAFSGCANMSSCAPLGSKKLKKIGANALKGAKKLTVLTIKSKVLTKAGVKGSLKGSSVKTVKVAVGSASANKTYAKKYSGFFASANSGRKVTVKSA